MKQEIIPFNSLVRHKMTGFEGVVVGRIEHMWDCIRYEVQPKVTKDGKLPESIMLGGPGLQIIAPPDNDIPPVIETPNAFEFNVKVRHIITGFTGIIVACMKRARSGNRYVIQPDKLDENGNIRETESFDEEDLIQIDPPPKPKKKDNGPKNPNGPHDRHIKVDKPNVLK